MCTLFCYIYQNYFFVHKNRNILRVLIIWFKQFFSRSSNVIVIPYFKDFCRIDHVPTFLLWPQMRKYPSALKFFKNLWPKYFSFSPWIVFRSVQIVSFCMLDIIGTSVILMDFNWLKSWVPLGKLTYECDFCGEIPFWGHFYLL